MDLRNETFAEPARSTSRHASRAGRGLELADCELDRGGGPDGNERMTAAAAAALMILLAAEGVTIVFLRPLLSAHVFIGMLLVPPVVLKLATTGYRFFRYYAGATSYRRKGPPKPLLRLLAPLVVLSTIGVFATGVALAVAGPPGGAVLALHKASFVVWLPTTGVHVLAYVWRVPRLTAADWRRRKTLRGSRLRRAVLIVTIVLGVGLAVATVGLATPWLSQWSPP